MQHTDKYKLNLIETSDPFSPEPLNENAQAIEAQLAALDAAKAPRTALAAETAAREAALTALAAQMGTLDTGRLRFKFDSYTGTGEKYTVPNRLEFDFKPLFLFIVHEYSTFYGSWPWIRGATTGRASLSSSGSYANISLTWEDRAVQWVNILSNSSADIQLNAEGDTYWYLALGVAE